jgi:hypothetical protein
VTIPGIIYLAALIFGLGVQMLQFVLAHSDADADADGDVDGDADVSGDVDAHHDLGDHGDMDHDAGGFLPILLSVRFWTFGAMAFGLVGSMLHFLRLAPMAVTPFVAVGMGLVCGFFASWVFKALARANTQSGATAMDAVGHMGKVLVPLKQGARGKVRIQLRGQTTDFLALSDEDEFEAGAWVLVTEIEEGQVHVVRAPDEFLRHQDED